VHLSRRLERDLLGVGERIALVPTKLMAHVRDAARSYGKSDPIDALAVARACAKTRTMPAGRPVLSTEQASLQVPDRDGASEVQIHLAIPHRRATRLPRPRRV
jgi:transposase